MAEAVFTTGHAAESGHWYTRTGAPAYEVPKKDGVMRPATLADARKNGWVPGVSGILRCAATPALEAWKADQLMMAALTLPRREKAGETEAEWIARVRQDSLEQGLAAAARGTEIHALIEEFLGQPAAKQMPDVVAEVGWALDNKFGWCEWQTEVTLSSELGYGGKADALSLGKEDILLDFKSKDPWPEGKPPIGYDEQAMQLAAYRYGLGRFEATCVNVFVSRVEPWQVHIHVWEEDELQRAFEMFKHLLGFWQSQKRYDSSFALAALEEYSF